MLKENRSNYKIICLSKLTNKTMYYCVLYIIYFIIITFIFNRFAYDIDKLNSGLRVFITSGKVSGIRNFRSDGIPVSRSPKIGQFISPFYVVHYGLIYSNGLKANSNNIIWQNDNSLNFWDVQPPRIKKEKAKNWFLNSLEWICDNINSDYGKAHLLYLFDWPYKNFDGGVVKSPWWSGLTDAYAILLLLRGYDYFNDTKYLDCANKLYESLLTEIEFGGSLNLSKNVFWIEEYVDPKISIEKMPYVLNGMVYSCTSIKAYECYLKKERNIYPLLENGICSLLDAFDKEYWSYYDLIGNPANIKYHRIHVELIKNFLNNSNDCKKVRFTKLLEKWEIGSKNSGYYYLLKGPKSIAYYQFMISYVMMVVIPFPVSILINNSIKRRRLNVLK